MLSRASTRFARAYATPRASFSVRAWSYTVRGCEPSCEGTTWTLYRDFKVTGDADSVDVTSSSCDFMIREASWLAR